MRLRAVCFILLVAALAAAQNAPKMVLEDPIKDFGTVVKGEILEWTYSVKNIGTADLVITVTAPLEAQ